MKKNTLFVVQTENTVCCVKKDAEKRKEKNTNKQCKLMKCAIPAFIINYTDLSKVAVNEILLYLIFFIFGV